jgi:hypothetical protein
MIKGDMGNLIPDIPFFLALNIVFSKEEKNRPDERILSASNDLLFHMIPRFVFIESPPPSQPLL